MLAIFKKKFAEEYIPIISKIIMSEIEYFIYSHFKTANPKTGLEKLSFDLAKIRLKSSIEIYRKVHAIHNEISTCESLSTDLVKKLIEIEDYFKMIQDPRFIWGNQSFG